MSNDTEAQRSAFRPIDPNTRIGHVHLKVADVDRALAFYCGVLGFELTQRYGPQAAFVCPPVAIIITSNSNCWESEGGSPPGLGATGLYLLAILYPTRAALADALRRLIDARISLDGASDHGVSEALYLRDPDGDGVSSTATARSTNGRARRMVGWRCTRVGSISERCWTRPFLKTQVRYGTWPRLGCLARLGRTPAICASPGDRDPGQADAEQRDRGRLRDHRDHAEHAVGLAIGAGGEIDRLRVAGSTAIPRSERPQSVDHERAAVSAVQLAEKAGGGGIKDVDPAVAEIADQQVAAERIERGGGERDAPGEFNVPCVATRRIRLPFRSNSSTKPFPRPATSSCLAASCSA